MLMAEKDLDAAEAQLEAARRLDPEALPAVELPPGCSHARGKDDEAVALLEAAYAAREKAPRPWSSAGGSCGVLEELKRPDAAERVGREVASTGPAG